MSGPRLNRRDFLHGAAVAAGGVSVSMTLPWLAGPVGAAEPLLARLSDWTIDDMWGAYPRYAEPIDYPRPVAPRAASAAAAGSIDALFYA